jgi:hypothetical protein
MEVVNPARPSSIPAPSGCCTGEIHIQFIYEQDNSGNPFPAAQSGLRVGDILVGINDQTVGCRCGKQHAHDAADGKIGLAWIPDYLKTVPEEIVLIVKSAAPAPAAAPPLVVNQFAAVQNFAGVPQHAYGASGCSAYGAGGSSYSAGAGAGAGCLPTFQQQAPYTLPTQSQWMLPGNAPPQLPMAYPNPTLTPMGAASVAAPPPMAAPPAAPMSAENEQAAKRLKLGLPGYSAALHAETQADPRIQPASHLAWPTNTGICPHGLPPSQCSYCFALNHTGPGPFFEEPSMSKGVSRFLQPDGQICYQAKVNYNGAKHVVGNYPTSNEAEAAYHEFWKNPSAGGIAQQRVSPAGGGRPKRAARSKAETAIKAAAIKGTGEEAKAALQKHEERTREAQTQAVEAAAVTAAEAPAAAAAPAAADTASAASGESGAKATAETAAATAVPQAETVQGGVLAGEQEDEAKVECKVEAKVEAGAAVAKPHWNAREVREEQEDVPMAAKTDRKVLRDADEDSKMRALYASGKVDEDEPFTTATILANKILRLLPNDAPGLNADEICATCYEKGQREEVPGEEVLSCSFCTEVYHNRPECLGHTYFPIEKFEALCDTTGEDEWACPKCFQEAHGRHLRLLDPESTHEDAGAWSKKVVVTDLDGGGYLSVLGQSDVSPDRLPEDLYVDRLKAHAAAAAAVAARSRSAAPRDGQPARKMAPCGQLAPIGWDKVTEVLDGIAFPCGTRKNVKMDEDDGQEGFCLGAVNSRGARGVSFSTSTGNMPNLTRLLVEFGRRALPEGFHFTSIQLNKNYLSAMHVDKVRPDSIRSTPPPPCAWARCSGCERSQHGPTRCALPLPDDPEPLA